MLSCAPYAILKKNAFSRRVPDLVTEELVAVLSRRTSFEFKQLFEILHENLRARNAASGGEEMLRLRAYEKLQNLVKLLLNLILLATAAVPRGGSVKVVVEGAATAPRFVLRSAGPSARVPPAFDSLVPGRIDGLTVDAQSVQAYYTGALARSANMTIAARLDGPDVVIEAIKAAAAPPPPTPAPV
jgi:hypothetical protein